MRTYDVADCTAQREINWYFFKGVVKYMRTARLITEKPLLYGLLCAFLFRASWRAEMVKNQNVNQNFTDEELSLEVWKPVAVKGFESCYEVSTLGRVRRLIDSAYNGSHKAGKILNLSCAGKYRHIKVNLYCDGQMTPIWLHRLVLITFVGSPPTALHEGAHNDGNAGNNRISNLRWATSRENTEDCRKHGTMVVGSRHFRAKLKESDIPNIFNFRNKGLTHQQIADKYGVHRIAIKLVLQRRTWKHVPLAA